MTELVKQSGVRPTRKVEAAAVGGAIATILMVVFGIFLPDQYAVAMKHPGSEAALASAIAFLFGYFARERM